MLEFSNLPLSRELIQNLTLLGHLNPTPIQSKSIPLILEGHDLLAIAQTGTGKTAAFALPIIHRLLENKQSELGALILTPTRELCLQIHLVIESFAKNLGLKSCAIFGGVDQAEQVKQLRERPQILVATPGRLLDLYEQKQIRPSHLQFLVLDEADRMLDMGFLDDIQDILSKLPAKKQTLLFSATMPRPIENLSKKVLKNPKKVEISPASSVPVQLEQRLIHCVESHKYQLLKKIIKEDEIQRVIVFTRTKFSANKIVEYLAHHRVASKTFHSDMKQEERERALQMFRDGSMKVLVATDMASRGIDVEDISHVINFELPLDPESYVHRIGRTARSGKKGIAISFCDESEKEILTKHERSFKLEFKMEKFEGKKEIFRFKTTEHKKITPPTPGKSQEKPSYLDHSKRQAPLKEGEKRVHPGFRNQKKKRK